MHVILDNVSRISVRSKRSKQGFARHGNVAIVNTPRRNFVIANFTAHVVVRSYGW